jgi:hypothetical protein
MGFGCSDSSKQTTIATVVDKDPLLTRFVNANGKNPYGSSLDQRRYLTITEAKNIVYSLRALSGNNPYLQDAVILYHIKKPITKRNDDFAMLNKDGKITVSFRLDLGDQKIRYQSLDGKKGTLTLKGGIGATLYHEHVHMWNKGYYATLSSGVEGESYGVEYYLTRRAQSPRSADILKHGEWGGDTPPDSNNTWLPMSAVHKNHYLLCVWAYAMKWCYDVADGKMSEPGIDKERALQCASDLVMKGQPTIEYNTDRGKALEWARAETNKQFGGDWNETTPLPNTSLTPDDSNEYRSECRARIASVLNASIP